MALKYPAHKDPFLEDEDDFSFASQGRQGRGAYGGTSSASYGGWEEPEDDFSRPRTQAEQLQELKENSMNRQLDSTKRAIASIYDSERVGVATAEELARQGEQLDNIERKTAQINADMKTTQRHINSIKSVFGGIKNWWTGKPDEKEKPKEVTTSSRPENTRLKEALDRAERHPDVHPAMKLKQQDVSGFYDDCDLDDRFMQGARGSGNTQQGLGSDSANRAQLYGSESRPAQRVTTFQDYDDKLDGHLDVMSDGMARLKMLATGLGDEIQSQNDQIEDRILPGAERADQSIRDQNRQMKRILGVKK